MIISAAILSPGKDAARYLSHPWPAAGHRLGGGAGGRGGRRGVAHPGRGRGPAPEADLQPRHVPQQLAGERGRDEAQRGGGAPGPVAP